MVEQRRERTPTTMGRPGWLTYAAIMMFVLGGFHILLAISEFANSTWAQSRLDIEVFTFAGLGIVRWLIHIPVSPVLAVVVIALNALVLYGLVEHEDYYS